MADRTARGERLPTEIECDRLARERDALLAEVERLREDNGNLAMALRYYLHDHREGCPCYACEAVRRYADEEIGSQA